MTRCLHHILVLVFGILLGEGKCNIVDSGSTLCFEDLLVCCPKESTKATKSKSPTWLVPSQEGSAAFDLSPAPEDLLPAQPTPFKGFAFTSFYFCSLQSSNDEETSFLEMWPLPCSDERNFSQVLEMWIRMEPVQRHFFCAARVQAGLRPADRASGSVEWVLMAITRQWLEKSTLSRQRAIKAWQEERRQSTSRQRFWQRTRTGTLTTYDAYDDLVYKASPMMVG